MRYLTIDTQSAVPVYLQIMEQIRTRVTEGDLAPGSPIPSVRQMATDLGINPNTVAKAYMLLEREGIILTVRRRGTFVSEMALARARQSLDARIDTTVDRIVDEVVALGIDKTQLLAALRRKLGGRPSDDDPTGGTMR
jgi:GntR family transcriptional regulator